MRAHLLTNVTKDYRKPHRKDFAMCLAMKRLPVEHQIAMSSIDRDIRDFLAGKNDGGGLLHALYDHVLDEPVPQSMRALLRG
jgi:hypothetical protein